jgi:hypothetical protein
MPFDCTPIVEAPTQLTGVSDDRPARGIKRTAGTLRPRPMPVGQASRRPESVDSTLAVLGRARELLAGDQRWCRGSFARSWFRLPVPVHSAVARRYCALGAIMRAGCELQLRVDHARSTLEWQTGRAIKDWNDDPARTHAEVIAAFDAAVVAVTACIA